MLVSAEVRWFWRNECPRQIHDWFFRSGLPPVDGRPRIDRYIQQPNNAELGIKECGDIAGLEIKGLVATRTSSGARQAREPSGNMVQVVLCSA